MWCVSALLVAPAPTGSERGFEGGEGGTGQATAQDKDGGNLEEEGSPLLG